MDLFKIIIGVYPELTELDFGNFGSIVLQDDADGKGSYIRDWNYVKPLSAELQQYKK